MTHRFDAQTGKVASTRSVVLVTHDVTICHVLKASLAGMHRIRIGLASLTALTLAIGPIIERAASHHLAATEAAPGTSPT